MKQGILITAYKNFQQLKDLVSCFDENFIFFIHIDKKASLSASSLQSMRKKNVAFISNKYKVNWGSFNHLRSILLLAEKAVDHPDLGLIHLISGQDFPIKSLQFFKDFGETNLGTNYLEHYPLPYEKWVNGGFDRIRQFHFYDFFNAKNSFGFKSIENLKKLQFRVGFQRNYPTDFPKLYGGSTWWTLSREAVAYVIHYAQKHPAFLKWFRYTFCPEELFFQTILANSPLAATIYNSDMRYIIWESRNGNFPAILDNTDFTAILSSHSLFARKFETPVSENLRHMILQQIITSTGIKRLI